MRKRVLHILNTTTFSGAENVVCQIIKMFENESGTEMAYASPDGPIRQALEERNITFIPLEKLCLSEVRRAVDMYNPDIIHAHDVKASFYASRVRKGRRFVSTIHGNDLKMKKVNLKSLLFYLAGKRADQILWVSKTCLQEYVFKDAVKQKSSVLYNVVDRDEILSKAGRDARSYNFEVIYLGRLSPEKDPMKLMRVIQLAVKQYPLLKAAIVGTGVFKEEMTAFSSKNGLDNNVQFLGFQSNPLKMLENSKVMIMTSIFEGTPMCALEAMALSVPIVSTPTDGMCEVVDDGVTGYLSSDEAELAKKVVEICTDNQLRNKLSLETDRRFAAINNVDEYKKAIASAYKL